MKDVTICSRPDRPVRRPHRSAAATLRCDRGTNPASVIIVLLVVMLVAELVVMGGRLAAAKGTVQNAAREAARAGSLVLTEADVEYAVDYTGYSNLANHGPHCVVIEITSTGTDFVRGGSVTANVRCDVDMSDMSSFGVPLPNVTLRGTHTEVVETYRVVEEISG